MADQDLEVRQVISRYHQAIVDRDMQTAFNCLGDSHFTMSLGQGRTDDPTLWRAGGYRTRDDLLRLYLDYDTPTDSTFANSIEFLHTDVKGNSAVVITRETGSSTTGNQTISWEGVTNLWCLAHIEKEWKIIGSMHHIGELPD